MSNIKPKHESLRKLSLAVYKKLPGKSLHPKTLEFLVLNHPKNLVGILDSEYTGFTDKCIVLDILSKSKGQKFVLEALYRYSYHEMPSIRESAIYSLAFFPTNKVVKRLEELEITESNQVIRDCVRSYLHEIFV